MKPEVGLAGSRRGVQKMWLSALLGPLPGWQVPCLIGPAFPQSQTKLVSLDWAACGLGTVTTLAPVTIGPSCVSILGLLPQVQGPGESDSHDSQKTMTF